MTFKSSISHDANIMLDELIKRQREKEALKKPKRRWFYAFLIIFAVTVFFIYYTTINRSGDDILQMFSNLFALPNLLLMFITAVVYFRFKYFADKEKSVAQRLENLRMEVVDRLNAPWTKTTKSRIRDEISEEMKSLGINIVYKN